jgi:G3E family GTPase
VCEKIHGGFILITLREFQPTGVIGDPELGLPALMENLFIRTFYEPRIKEKIGWIGIAYRAGLPGSWTLKLKGRRGVYCLSYRKKKGEEGWVHGSFDLQYFPQRDEPLLDLFSIRENLLRQDHGFETWVRYLPGDEDPLENAFIVGRILLSVDPEEKNLFLSLWSPLRWLEFRKEGLSLTRDDGTRLEVLPPGGKDRNVPAFALSFAFFDRLVQAFAYHFKGGPVHASMKKRKAPVWEITGNHEWVPRAGQETSEYFVTVGFGHADGHRNAPRIDRLQEFLPDAAGISGYLQAKPNWVIRPGTGSPKGMTRLWWEAPEWKVKSGAGPFQTLGIQYRPPLLVITGFLGSGKTTLLNQIVEYKTLMANRFVAVIQNEVGSVSVDESLTDSAYNVTSMEEGCVCCTLLGDLRHAVRRLCLELDPDMIILETTGVADPSNILEELPALEDFVRFDSVVTVVDGANFNKALEAFPVVTSQVKSAGLILLNKVDLLTEKEKEDVEKGIRTINPRAPIIRTVHTSIQPGLLFSMEDDTDVLRAPEPEAAPVRNGYRGHVSKALETDLHSQGIISFTVQVPGFFDTHRLTQYLDQIPDSVYRLKGVVRIAGVKQTQLVQYVSGHYELTHHYGSGVEPNTLVFIGRDMNREELEGRLRACLADDGG